MAKTRQDQARDESGRLRNEPVGDGRTVTGTVTDNPNYSASGQIRDESGQVRDEPFGLRPEPGGMTGVMPAGVGAGSGVPSSAVPGDRGYTGRSRDLDRDLAGTTDVNRDANRDGYRDGDGDVDAADAAIGPFGGNVEEFPIIHARGASGRFVTTSRESVYTEARRRHVAEEVVLKERGLRDSADRARLRNYTISPAATPAVSLESRAAVVLNADGSINRNVHNVAFSDPTSLGSSNPAGMGVSTADMAAQTYNVVQTPAVVAGVSAPVHDIPVVTIK